MHKALMKPVSRRELAPVTHWVADVMTAGMATTAGHAGGHYVGYPMGYWCEFAPGYGFHQGFVHPTPRTHGCIRLKGEAAAKFFALVRIGTPVNIATTQPEDATIGPTVQRVDDSRTPDPDPHLEVTDAAFEAPSGPLLE